MCFGDWSRLDLFTPQELVEMLDDSEASQVGDVYVDDEVLIL